MVFLYGSLDDHADIDCDLWQGRNQSIQQFSILSCEENDETRTDLDSPSFLFSAVYNGDEYLFWFVLNLCDLAVLDCFNNLVYKFAFVLVIRVNFKISFHCFVTGMGAAIVSVIGFLCLGPFTFVFCSKNGADILQQALVLRRLLRLGLRWFTRRVYSGKISVRPEGFMVGAGELHTLKLWSPTLSLVLIFIVLDLTVLGSVMKVKTTSIRSISVTSSGTIVTASSMPSQHDSFRSRHLKTHSDYRGYMRHFGYYSRHFGYVLVTVTTRWVIVTLIALGNLKFKNSSSCYIHVLMIDGLDLFQSLPCALTHSGFVQKISLTQDVCSSPLRERWFSETVFSSERIDLIGKNWWRCCNLYEYIVTFKKKTVRFPIT